MATLTRDPGLILFAAARARPRRARRDEAPGGALARLPAAAGRKTPQSVAQLDVSPIFLHSSFRTSSTWLWSKLRVSPHTLAYYEIFNEGLAKFGISDVATCDYMFWDSKHPATAPYFLEYLPLFKAGGGIAGLSPRMALESFIPSGGLDGELDPEEKAYVELLISHAYASRKIPVLTCTRTLGRVRALRKAFGGRAVFAHRNLFHQWASYAGQAMAGNPYFLNTIDATLKGSRHDPFLAMVDDWSARRTISPTDEMLFQAFLLLHLYVSAHAYADSDLVVDVTALTSRPDLQRTVGAQLSHMVGAPVDLSDASPRFEISPLEVRSVQSVVDTLGQFTKMIRATCYTQQSADFVETMKDAAVAEWQRHEFFVAGNRRVFGAQLAEANRRADATAGLLPERDALAHQLSGALAAIAALDARSAALAAEAEAAVGRASAAETAREDLAHQLSGAQAAIAGLEARSATLAAEAEAAVGRASAAESAREDLAQQLSAAQAAGAALEARSAALAAEVEPAVGRAAAAESAREDLAQQLSAAQATIAALEARSATLAAEAEAAVGRAAAAETAREDLTHQLSGAKATIDVLEARIAVLVVEAEAVVGRASAAEMAREDLAHQLSEAQAAVAAQVAEADAAAAERVVMARHVTELEAAARDWATERDVLVAAQVAASAALTAALSDHAAALAGLRAHQAQLTVERDALLRHRRTARH